MNPVKAFREKHGLTSGVQVSKVTGISTGMVNYYERDVYPIDPSALDQLKYLPKNEVKKRLK